MTSTNNYKAVLEEIELLRSEADPGDESRISHLFGLLAAYESNLDDMDSVDEYLAGRILRGAVP